MPSHRLELPVELTRRRKGKGHGRYRAVQVFLLKAVAAALIRHADFATGLNARPGVEQTLVGLIGLDQRRIRYALNALEYLGIIRVTEASSRGKSTTYQVLIGRVGLTLDTSPEAQREAKRIAARVQTLIAAYTAALKLRHSVDCYVRLASVNTWIRYIAPIEQLAARTRRPFGILARLVMREYMDEKGHDVHSLEELRHPPQLLGEPPNPTKKATYLDRILERVEAKLRAADRSNVEEAELGAEPLGVHETGDKGRAAIAAMAQPGPGARRR